MARQGEVPKEFSIPKTLGACADRLYELGVAKAEAQKRVDALSAEESALEQHIIDQLEVGEQNGVIGRKAKVSVGTEEYPTVEDWPKFWEHIFKRAKKDLAAGFAFLQKRPAAAVCRELWEAGETIPGVKKFIKKKVSVRKA